ncbi:transcriptional regulator domain-containing protein [Massilia timonae]|uniref:transcriptional regulator domain-containing protein n=1 Tax=Massilia timonae TaxID=47229 RepID=UPI00351CE59C
MTQSISRGERWHAPDWRDPEAYGDVKSWSYRRWAWEFLRRNTEYQQLKGFVGPPNFHLERGRKFGRARVRPYWRDYDQAEEGDDVWLVDQITYAQGWDGWNTLSPTPLASTEMWIKFDLALVMRSGEVALNVLMAKIKGAVQSEMANCWREPNFPDAPLRRPSTEELFQYLRLTDAGKTRSRELAPFLYREYCTPEGIADPVLVTAGASHISRQRSKARAIVEREYLCLVPITEPVI